MCPLDDVFGKFYVYINAGSPGFPFIGFHLRITPRKSSFFVRNAPWKTLSFWRYTVLDLFERFTTVTQNMRFCTRNRPIGHPDVKRTDVKTEKPGRSTKCVAAEPRDRPPGDFNDRSRVSTCIQFNFQASIRCQAFRDYSRRQHWNLRATIYSVLIEENSIEFTIVLCRTKVRLSNDKPYTSKKDNQSAASMWRIKRKTISRSADC